MNTTATKRDHQSTQKPKQPQQRQTAKEIIASNVKSLIEQLEAGHSDALTAYLDAMSRFHNYSFGNILEIARQKPDATRVAGMYAWNQLGRRVKKGEKGIRILAPIIGIKRKPKEEAEKDITKQNRAVLVGFRAAYVFDVSQTDGAELPAMHEVSGDVGSPLSSRGGTASPSPLTSTTRRGCSRRSERSTPTCCCWTCIFRDPAGCRPPHDWRRSARGCGSWC